MKVYISGISGTGMGPLALMARQAGYDVCGSDLSKGAIYDELLKAGIEVKIGTQDGQFLKQKLEDGIDWFVYTSALPPDHPELTLALKTGIKCTKRDDFTAHLVDELHLKMVAVAGTHGKTTTTSMIVFAAKKLNIKAAYIVGTTLGFAPSGAYHKNDEFFIYEADEYDRNFLKYHPWLSIIPSISYDHPDTYPTRDEYLAAFNQFKSQSRKVIENGVYEEKFELAGEKRRKDASLAAAAILEMSPNIQPEKIIDALNQFPGVGRRFEKIVDGVYSDYAHHPEEIAATIDVAKDEARFQGKKGIVVVYQPHQNTRQHEVFNGYKDAFLGANKIFWIPTYLTRENPNLEVIQPDTFIKTLANSESAEVAELNNELRDKLLQYVDEGYLVLMLSAGPADGWLRENFA